MSFSRFRIALDELNEQDNEFVAAHPSLAYLRPSRRSRCLLRTGTADDAGDQATAAFLCALTVEILDILCNEKDYAHPTILQYVDPNFETNKDGDIGLPLTRSDYLSNAASTALRMPNLSGKILSSVAKVHKSERSAEVWTSLRMGGLPVSDARAKLEGEVVEGDGIVKECVSVLRWEKREEQWVCASVKVMRGVSGI